MKYKIENFKNSVDQLFIFLCQNSQKDIDTLIQIEFDIISRNYWENYEDIKNELSADEIKSILKKVGDKIKENEENEFFWSEITKKTLQRVKKEITFN